MLREEQKSRMEWRVEVGMVAPVGLLGLFRTRSLFFGLVSFCFRLQPYLDFVDKEAEGR